MGERACCVLTTGRHPLNRKFNKQHHQPINNNTRSLIIALEAKITAAPTMQVTILACLAAVLVLAPAVRAQDCDENCLWCHTGNMCMKCAEGYTSWTNPGQECQPCEDELCLSCDSFNTAKCWVCEVGHGKDENGKCYACGDEKCKYCAESSVCQRCAEGFGLNQQGACERCEDELSKFCGGSDLSECFECVFATKKSEQGTCESTIGQCFEKTAKTQLPKGKCVDREQATSGISNYMMAVDVEMSREKCAELCKATHVDPLPMVPDGIAPGLFAVPCAGFDYNFAAEPFEDCRCWFHSEANIAAEELRPNENVEFWQLNHESCETLGEPFNFVYFFY